MYGCLDVLDPSSQLVRETFFLMYAPPPLSLPSLREQWVVRLNQRNQQQQSFFDERIRRTQKAQQGFGKLGSP